MSGNDVKVLVETLARIQREAAEEAHADRVREAEQAVVEAAKNEVEMRRQFDELRPVWNDAQLRVLRAAELRTRAAVDELRRLEGR